MSYTVYPEGEVRLYDYGNLWPTLTMTAAQIIDKYFLCIVFNQKLDQRVHIYRGCNRIYTIGAEENLLFYLGEAGSYIVFFESCLVKYGYNWSLVEIGLALLTEMTRFHRAGGDLRCPLSYPHVFCVMHELERFSNYWRERDQPGPAFYGVGSKTPVMEGNSTVTKITVCMMFKQSVYQDVKVFYKNEFHALLSNCFNLVETKKPGKYVVIFQNDTIYYKTNSEIGEELRKIEDKLKVEEDGQKRCPKKRKKTKKNNKKKKGGKAKKKEKKLRQKSLKVTKEPSATSSTPEVPAPPIKPPVEKKKDAQPVVKIPPEPEKKREKKQKKAEEIIAEDLDDPEELESFNNESSSSFYEEKDKRGSISSSSNGMASSDSSLFTKVSTNPVGDDQGKAVVVGIHPKGLIIQTLPKEEKDSEFMILDGIAQCWGPDSLTDHTFNINMLHVFLKVFAVAKLDDAITNDNQTHKGKRIEKRVTSYALYEGQQWQNGFQRGWRYDTRKSTHYKQKENKLICLIVETNEEGKEDIVRVVGPPSHLSFLAKLEKKRNLDGRSNFYWDNCFTKNEFIIADSFTADPYFKLHIMFDNLCLVKSYQAEENFLKKSNEDQLAELRKLGLAGSTYCKKLSQINDPPDGDTVLFNIRKLDKEEHRLIKTCCKDRSILKKKKASFPLFDDARYNFFRLYIRDPALCICRFNSYNAYKNSQNFTVKTRVDLIEEKGDIFLVFTLTRDQIEKVLPKEKSSLKATKGNTYWREGAELKIVNPILMRGKQSRFGFLSKSDADVIIDEIVMVEDELLEEINALTVGGNPGKSLEMRAMIVLRPAKNSKDLFDVLKKYRADFSKEISLVGPSGRDGASESLATGLQNFEAFYKNTAFFNWWRGYKDPNVEGNFDYLNELSKANVRIRKAGDPSYELDESQSTAFQHAFHRGGITSIGAGPGSGKTLLCGGLISKCYDIRMDERMALTATTNNGVNNAVEKLAELRPGFPISREMSKKGEEGISEELEKYSLRYQALFSQQTHPHLRKAREDYGETLAYYKKARTLKEKLTRLELLHLAESTVKREYLRIVVPFCGASTPALLVRHADHYNLVYSPDNVDHYIRRDIKHLIIDEASQLPYYASLALCCSFPFVERMTIIGDRMQLGPYCVLSIGGLLYDLCRLSELDRVNGLKTVEEFCLRRNYRSHPYMVESEQDQYGESFKSALTFLDRRMAYCLNLPLFKGSSAASMRPVAFINIDVGDDCHNASERRGVLKLIEVLMNKKVRPGAISVLCFHRKQKEEMLKSFRVAGYNRYKMKKFLTMLGGVHTIDSFQGRENEVIIVCTTKTTSMTGQDKTFYQSIFQFVADPQRATVAMSRAKEALYVFGQWRYLRYTSFWKNKIANMKKDRLLYDEDWHEM